MLTIDEMEIIKSALEEGLSSDRESTLKNLMSRAVAMLGLKFGLLSHRDYLKKCH